jgi:spore coat polysaccharide biosynthesis protein SpsF (cytidylyltransferase family)
MKKEDITNRNNSIELFFKTKFNLIVEVIINNRDSPLILIGNKILSCYVHNFKIIFNMIKDDNKSEVFRYHLLDHAKKATDEESKEFMEWLIQSNHHECFKLSYGDTETVHEHAIQIMEWLKILIEETKKELKKYENSDC